MKEWFNDFLNRLLEPINIAGPVMFSLHMIMWGLWLLMPWLNFTGPAFAVLASIAPEWEFGIASVVLGAVALIGAISGRPTYLAVSSFLAFMYWFLIGLAFAAASITSTGVLTYMIIAMYSAFTYLNVRYNVKHGRWHR
jgi:hypothetical protein